VKSGKRPPVAPDWGPGGADDVDGARKHLTIVRNVSQRAQGRTACALRQGIRVRISRERPLQREIWGWADAVRPTPPAGTIGQKNVMNDPTFDAIRK
jgi:hypothetical protein